MPVSKAIQICMVEAKIETVARMCCFYGNILHRKHLRKHLGISDLYNIYNALVVNEFHELSTSVLSCIKDIENKVAVETDSENSSSNRSRSSSIHSASADNVVQTEDTRQSNAQYVKSPDKIDGSDKDSVLKTDIIDQDLELDGPELHSFDTSLQLTPVSRLNNEPVDELDGADVVKDNVTENCDFNHINIGTENNTNSLHSADLIDKCVSEDGENKQESFAHSNVTEDVQVKPMWNVEDGERGEPDGNSYHDEYNEVGFLQDGNQGHEGTCNHFASTSDNNFSSESGKYGFPGPGEVFQLNVDLAKENITQNIPLTNKTSSVDSTNNLTKAKEFQSSEFSSLMHNEDIESHSPSSGVIKENNIDCKDANNDIHDDDVFIAENMKTFGPRRSSLTSLSSYSSAEVTLDQSGMKQVGYFYSSPNCMVITHKPILTFSQTSPCVHVSAVLFF